VAGLKVRFGLPVIDIAPDKPNMTETQFRGKLSSTSSASKSLGGNSWAKDINSQLAENTGHI